MDSCHMKEILEGRLKNCLLKKTYGFDIYDVLF